MSAPAFIASIFGSSAAKQCGLLIGAQGFAMLLSFAFTMLITRSLDVGAYGVFRYATTFLALAMTLLQFGWPYSAARRLALENDRSAQKQIVGACVIMVVISTVVGTTSTLVAFFAAEALGYHLPRILIWVAPFLYVSLGQYMIGSICQGLNRISVLSFQQVLPYILLLPITAVQISVFHKYSLQAAIIGYIAVFSAVITFGFFRLGVAFTHSRSWLRVISAENRRTGFPIYIGGIFGVASAHLVALWVAEFAEVSRYGQYALALAVSSPLAVSVSSIGTVIFRSSSSSKSLSKKILCYSFGFGGLLGVVYFIATENLLVRAFGSQYTRSVRMAQVLGVGSLMIGWGDIFQRFLGAQGQGKKMCIAAVSTGIVGIVSAAILLPKWDAYGAIVSSVLAATTYFGLNLALYIRHTTRHGHGRVDLIDSGSIAHHVKRCAP
jgi:O-antigen/teichoic acid export membrane protein